MKNSCTLNTLKVGEQARVEALQCHSRMRRRMLDIGLTEDALIRCVGRSPAGDPAAYLIRGAVIAIRDADAACVYIKDRKACV